MDILQYIVTHSPIWYLVQPLWRDEAFSVLFVKHSLSYVVNNSTVEPPLYYTLLWIWTRLFGTDEITVRLLSMIGFLISTYVVTVWAEKRFGNTWIAVMTALLYFTNPMLLYYAFEVRAYGWYMLFSVLCISSYLEKRWGRFLLAVIFGFYTHLYMVILLGATAIHYFLINGKKLWNGTLREALWDPMVRILIIFSVAVIPWVFRIFSVMDRLRISWYFPVDMQLLRSALGNLYLGYEGTPWFLWDWTARLSLVILGIIIYLVWNRETRKDSVYLSTIIGISVLGVIGYSALIKPMYVSRYLVFVTAAEVMLIPYLLTSIRRKIVAIGIAGSILVSTLMFSSWYPQQHAKKDYRTPIREINALMRPSDRLYLSDAIFYPEALYYVKDPDTLYLYNPSNQPFPWYVGDAIFDVQKNRSTFPPYPSRTFLLNKDGTYSMIYSMDSIRSIDP